MAAICCEIRGGRSFERLYIAFGGLKDGFNEAGCRVYPVR